MEKRTTPADGLEIRSLVGDLHIESRDTGTAGRTIVGYAAKFECWSDPILGWFREKIARGAFDGCDMQDVIMCFNHCDNAILARTTSGTLRLEVDDVGLRFAFEAPHTTVGNDMLELVRRGDVSRCSFRFGVKEDVWQYADARNGLDLDERTILRFSYVVDVSLVTFPAYPATEASVLRLEKRKQEWLREQATESVSRSKMESLSRKRLADLLKLKQ